jgi:hypothetical protein
LIGSSDVKNKFKSAIDEYLEKIKGYWWVIDNG